MKKFLAILGAGLLMMSVVRAEIQTYEGTEEYYVLGAVENINVARERARERAIRAARERAGVYIHSFSRTIDFELIEDEVISVASGVLRIIETHYEKVDLPEENGYLIRATVKADIDTSDLEKFLRKDSDELSEIVAQDKVIRTQEDEHDRKIESLKSQYKNAASTEEQETIAEQIAAEDKAFLSNLKLREGNRYRDEKNYKKATELFTEAIELNPDNVLAWNNRGWAQVEQRNYKQAMDDFNKALELDPTFEMSYCGRGWVYHHQQKNFAAAIKEFNKAIELNPRYTVAWNNRGAAKSWLNQMREAVADYDRAIELNPRYAKAYENRGKAYLALGEYDKSFADSRRAERIFHSNRAADKIIDEALDFCKRGDPKRGLELLNDAAKRFPDNQYIFVNRGNIYNNNYRDFNAAIADYNKTIEINPQFSWPYMNRAIALGRLKRWDDAIVDYGRALDIDQNYADAYNGRAWAYCQTGKFDEALVDVDKAIKLKPNEANYYDTRACAYMGLKRYSEAVADLQTAIKLSPNGGYYNLRGEIYKLMGEDDKAQSDFNRAKELGYSG